jgi:hypothetical protein
VRRAEDGRTWRLLGWCFSPRLHSGAIFDAPSAYGVWREHDAEMINQRDDDVRVLQMYQALDRVEME